MSGNTTMLGIAIGRAEWGRAATILGLIALFVAGAAGGTVLGTVAGRQHATAVTFGVTLILAAPLALPGAEIPAFVIAMGALNASMSSIGNVAVSLTYVTGTLVKFGQGLGRAICGRTDDLTWAWQIPMWLSLLAGAVGAVFAQPRFGNGAGWPLPALAALLTLGALARNFRTGWFSGRLPPR